MPTCWARRRGSPREGRASGSPWPTLIAVTAGTLCAIGCWRIGRRSTELVRALMLLPLIIPAIVYAIGLYRWFGTLDLLDRFLGVTLAHGVTGIPYVVITVSTALAAFDPRLEQAARGMGASLGQTLRWVILPRIMPGIASGAIFAFIHSWDELIMVLFIASRQVFTLPRKIWDGINENLDPTMAAVAVLLILFTILLLILDMTLRAGQDGCRGRPPRPTIRHPKEPPPMNVASSPAAL